MPQTHLGSWWLHHLKEASFPTFPSSSSIFLRSCSNLAILLVAWWDQRKQLIADSIGIPCGVEVTLHMYFLIFSFLCVFVFLSREVKYRYSKQIPPKNISTNKCPPKVYLPTLMTMICVREGSTGHIPCVHYSQVEPIPLRPLLFSDYHQHHPILSSSPSQFMQNSHISFQFLPAGSIKIKLGWKYHHSKCLAIFTTWNISLWAFGAIQSSKDYLVNHLCKSSGHALVDYEQKGAV